MQHCISKLLKYTADQASIHMHIGAYIIE